LTAEEFREIPSVRIPHVFAGLKMERAIWEGSRWPPGAGSSLQPIDSRELNFANNLNELGLDFPSTVFRKECSLVRHFCLLKP
jgi:hypothetical protein